MSSTTTYRDTARQLEADAVRYPEERGEALIEAAGQWKLAGDTTRAVEVLDEVRGLGGLDAEYARYSLSEICFERGADAEAWLHLEALEACGAKRRPRQPGRRAFGAAR